MVLLASQIPLLSMLLFLSSSVVVVMAAYVWLSQDTRVTKMGSVFMLITILWSMGYSLELLSLDFVSKLLWHKVAYAGSCLVPILFYIYVAQLLEFDNIPDKLKVVLSIPVVAMLSTCLVNPYHPLIWTNVTLVAEDPFAPLYIEYGSAYIVGLAYNYLLLLAAAYLFFRTLFLSWMLYRTRVTVLLICLVLPSVTNIAHVFKLTSFPFDLTPLILNVTVLSLAILSPNRIINRDVIPVAREVVLESMKDAVLLLGQDDQVLYMNSAAEELIEPSQGGSEQNKSEKVSTKALITNMIEMKELVIQRDGERRVFDVNISYLGEGREKETHRIVVLRDISRRKKLEERLEESESRYRNLADNSADVVLTIDLEGNFTYVSKSMELSTDYVPNDLVGRNVEDFLIPESRELVLNRILGWLDGEKTQVPYTVWMRAKEGGVVPFELNTSPILEDDRIVGIQMIARSISERVNYQTRLEVLYQYATLLSDARSLKEIAQLTLRAVVQTLGFTRCGFGIIEKGQIVFLLHEGLEESKNLEVSLSESDVSVKAIYSGKTEYVRDVGIDEKHHEYPQESMISRSKLSVPVKVDDRVVAVINVESNKLDAFDEEDIKIMETLALSVASAIDKLSYLVSLEELIKEKTRELRDAQRMATIGETAAMVGHDLRNPLQVIIGTISVLKRVLEGSKGDRTPPGDEIGRWIGKIEDQSKYMNKIITDLQHYARPMILDCGETCIQDLLEEVTSTMGIPLNITTSIDFEEGYPDLWIDPAMMRRVFINLITNAIQAMPDGGRLLIKGHTSDGAAYVDVMDTGEGMTEELMREIFKPLVTTKAKGTGLGLPVCKRIIDAHKGEILVTSEKGGGSIFTLKLNVGRWDLENGDRPTALDITGGPETAVPIEHDDISVKL